MALPRPVRVRRRLLALPRLLRLPLPLRLPRIPRLPRVLRLSRRRPMRWVPPRPRRQRPAQRPPPLPLRLPPEAAASRLRWTLPNQPVAVAQVRRPRWTRRTRGPHRRPPPPRGLQRPPRGCPEVAPPPLLPLNCSPARTSRCRLRRARCSPRAALTRGCCRFCPTPSATTRSCSVTPSRLSTRSTRRPWTSSPSTVSRSGRRTSRRVI